MTDTINNIILYLAPLRGFTEYIYRNAFSRHFDGFDIAVAPFIPTMSDARLKRKNLKDVLPENNHDMPVIPQIIGNNAEDFILLASRLYDLGYETVNWNLGCPFPMVAKKQRGSGLLPHPDKIETFLEETIPAIPNRLCKFLVCGCDDSYIRSKGYIASDSFKAMFLDSSQELGLSAG